MARAAVFLDRDGTLVEPRHYPSRPEELVLYGGLGPRLRMLHAAGFALVVITNQSGLARGYFDVAALERMHAHLRGLLAHEGVTLDGIYHCPHHVDGIVPALAVACDCRKPRPGLLVRAARELDVELRRSWFIGDILDDVEAGNRAGCRTVLVDLGTEAPPANHLRRPTFVARDTAHALDIVAAEHGVGAAVCLTHRPAGWRSSPASAALVQAGDAR